MSNKGEQLAVILDCGSGFDRDLRHDRFDAAVAGGARTIVTEYVIDDRVAQNYPGIKFVFDFETRYKILHSLRDYRQHPSLCFKNFLCSFNGAAHVSRKLLVSILHKLGHYHADYVSKNFRYDVDVLDGHLGDYVDQARHRVIRKFFLDDDDQEFFQTVNSFGHLRFEHDRNIYNLEQRLIQSFIHVVSESVATSYYPYVTEKFLYSVVTRGLFLSYAQPGWHAHLEKYYGFRAYTKLFDYRFDTLDNPIERLIELVTMISKFSALTTDEWWDLYHVEADTIEYNYDHYFSGDYLKRLQDHSLQANAI